MNENANINGRVLPPSSPPEGFASVARWISFDPDNETFIYRKFGELAARNLLYLQCELLVLERQLNDLDQNDTKSDDMDLKDAARTWETFTQQYEDGIKEANDRMDMITRLRAKLKEYNEALLLQREIMKLERPNKRVLDAYREWFKTPYPALGGRAKTVLDNSDDLVALNMVSEADYLSILLRRHWPVKEELCRGGLHCIGRFDEKSISTTAAIISILVAAILLLGSIISLYFTTNNAVRLGLVATFTIAFALSVCLMTNARRAEIFTATAAYAAVLEVLNANGGYIFQ
ncbi:hypothetical protein ZTR_07476 [Talaromyces verruculosus]|nr:hypothetical protein ZTR_07476 [Talaromyces verruculosus]